MFEWVVVVLCFVVVALGRMFLFKKSFKKKLKYYTHPENMAQDVIEESKKTGVQFQNSINIDKVSQQIGYNLGCVVRIIDEENPNFEQICDRLRNISLYINILKIVHQNNIQTLTENLKIIGSIIGPRLETFTKIRKYVEEQNKDPKLMKKRDQNLDYSVDAYIQHIVEDLSAYMFGF